MANSFVTSKAVSDLAVELLSRSLVLVNTVDRVPEVEYAGPSGGTVTVVVPATRTASEQSTAASAVTYADISESSVDVAVSHFYDAALIGDEATTYDIVNFGRQILQPQVESVARKADDQLVAVLNGLTASTTLKWAKTSTAAADLATVLAIREQLTKNLVPATDRWLACAPDIITRLLGVSQFVEADQRGSSDALTSAQIGQVFGLNVIECEALTAGTSVAYHRSGFLFASVAAKTPAEGLGVSANVATVNGITLRHAIGYDIGHLATASICSLMAGAAAVTESDSTYKRSLAVSTAAS